MLGVSGVQDSTHLQASGGAPGQVGIRPSFPSRLYSNESAAPGILDAVRNTYPSQASTRVTTTIHAQPLSTGAQHKYDRVPVFVHKAQDKVSERQGVYSLEYMNWVLRQAALEKHAALVEHTVRLQTGQKRKATPNSRNFASFPTTVDEFIRDFKYMGYVVAKEGQDPDYSAIYVADVTFTVQLAGEINSVANYWGDYVRSGDIVGFKVKSVPWGTSGIQGWQGGQLQSDSPPINVIQVVPSFESHLGGCDIGTIAPDHKDNGDFMQQLSHKVPTKTITIDAVTGETKEEIVVDQRTGRSVVNQVIHDTFEPAFFIPVGRMLRRWQTVSQDEIDEAIVSFNGLVRLQRETKTIDMALTPTARIRV